MARQPPPHLPQQQTRLVGGGGRPNIVRLGLPSRRFNDLYHKLLNLSWPRLLGLLSGLYIGGNMLFALVYYLDPNGIENASGSYLDSFFFSVQTMATIGYGKMVPRSVFANLMVTIEAFLGLMSLAMITGLLFAKFSKPTARVLWSRVAAVSTREGVPSLMLRMANERGNQIVEAQLRLVLARNETTQEGEKVRRFHDLALVRERNAIFALTWTAVHPITPASPLYGHTSESLRAIQAEIICSLMGIDETFSQTVHARHSYIVDEILWDVRFVDILGFQADGKRYVDYARFHEVEPASRPSSATTSASP
jgi:inward rectifier potassium channel